jgi:hypothetical protein
MSHLQRIHFGILEYDASVPPLTAHVLADARRKDGHGVCWLPSGGPALTDSLKRTLDFIGAPWTMEMLGAAALARELETHGVILPDDGPTPEGLISGPAPLLVRDVSRPGQPMVLGIGADGAHEACKFALLTGRPVRLVTDRDALPAAMSAMACARSLMIAPGAAFDNELLHALAEAMRRSGCDIPHGWLYPFGVFERDYALLKCVIFGYAAPPEPRPFHFMFPLEAAADVRVANGDRWVFGQALSAADSVSLLQEPAEFLAITGHSNGIDMGVGGGVLCPRDGAALSDADRVLPCFNGAGCSRRNARNELCAVSSVRCEVAMLYTCWGAVLNRHVYDFRSSLLFDLVKSPAVGAVVTTYASTLMDASASVEMAEQYARRVRLGVAVQSVNAGHYRRYRDVPHALVLFGDPDQRSAHERPLLDSALRQAAPIARVLLHRRAEPIEIDQDGGRQCAHVAAIAGRISAINHLRAVVSGHRALQLEAIGPALARVSAGLDRIWLWNTRYLLRVQQFGATGMGSAGAYIGELQRVHDGLFDFFGSMVSQLGGLLHLQTDGMFLDDSRSRWLLDSTCPYCGSRSLRVTQRMAGDDRVVRQLHKCDNCAVVQDSDASIADASFDTHDTWPRSTGGAFRLRAHFNAEMLRQPFLAGVVMEPFHKRQQLPPLRVFKTGTLEPGDGMLDVAFDALPLPEGTVRGSYFLNALFLIGERHAFMRRAIYLN